MASAAEPGAEAADYINTVSDQFVVTLARHELAFVGDDELTALREELHGYLSARVQQAPSAAASRAALDGIDRHVARMAAERDPYSAFRGEFDMLCWQLWVLTELQELTPAQQERRDEQRDWMRAWIRGLPAQEGIVNGRELSHESQLEALELEVLYNPLSPFFHDPMTDDEFAKFTAALKLQQERGFTQLLFAPAHIFTTGLTTRLESLLKRWPPGFPVSGWSTNNANHYSFRASVFNERYQQLSDDPAGVRTYFDVEGNRTVQPPPSRDEEAIKKWLADGKQGDLCFDLEEQRLIPVRGARLTTLDKADWRAIDKVPLAKLRTMLSKQPIEFYSVAKISQLQQTNPGAADQLLKELPALVLESAEGKMTILRIIHLPGGTSVQLQSRPRPLPPYPPFHPGDDVP